MNEPKIFIAGANGFVGKTLCQTLKKEGYKVTAQIRRGTDPSDIKAHQTKIIDDPWNETEWLNAMTGCDIIIDLIGKAHENAQKPKTQKDQFYKINVNLTDLIHRCATQTGAKKFIYLSSIKAVGEGAKKTIYTESTPCHPEDVYGKSKLAAETMLLTKDDPIQTIIIRPPLIYGPNLKGNLLTMIKAIAQNKTLPFGCLSNKRSMLFVENLSHFIIALINSPTATGVYHIADQETPTMKEFCLALKKGLGSKSKFIPIPKWLINLGATLIGKRSAAKKITGSLQVSSERHKDLNYTQPFTSGQALQQTCKWYISGQKQQ